MVDTVVVTSADDAPAVLQPTLTDAIAAVQAFATICQNGAQSASDSVNTVNALLAQVVAAAAASYSRTSISDVDRTGQVSDRFVEYKTLTASRTYTMPQASLFPPGKALTIADGSGNCSSTNLINIVPSGSDTFLGSSNPSIASAGASISFIATSNNSWVIR